MVFPLFLELGEGPESDERYLDLATEQSLAMAELGYSLFFTEHHFRGSWNSAPLQFASYLAPQLPEDTWLGFAVVCVPYYHPVRLVESMNMLDQLMRGRVVFGLGTGFPGAEPASLGFSNTYEEGRSALAESLEIMERLWAFQNGDPAFSFETERYRGTVVKRIVPAPYRKPRPLLIGAGSRDETFLRAAENGWPVFVGSFGDVEVTARQLGLYHRALEDAGHPPAVLEACRQWCSYDWLAVAVAETDEEAEADYALAREERLRNRKIHVEHQDQTVLAVARNDDGTDLRREALLAGADMSHAIVGSPDTVAAKVQQVADLGINHIMLRFMGEWYGETRFVAEKSMRLFAEHVAPRFTNTGLPVTGRWVRALVRRNCLGCADRSQDHVR